MSTVIKQIGGQNPWAYWSLDGDAITSLEDKSGNSRHLTKFGTPIQTLDKDSIADNAIGNIGSGNYLKTPTFPSLAGKAFTLSFWFKVTNLTNHTIFQHKTSFQDLVVTIYNNQLQIYVGTSFYTSVVPNEWKNVIITHSVDNKYSIYINGVAILLNSYQSPGVEDSFYFGESTITSNVVTIDECQFFESKASDGGISVGDVASGEIDSIYTSGVNQLSLTILPSDGTYNSYQNISMSCLTVGASIYYTVDGTNPTSLSTLYTNSFVITSSSTIKAIAIKNGMSSSNITTGVFTISTPTLNNKIIEIIDYINTRIDAHPFGKKTLQSWNVNWTQNNSPTTFESTVIDLWQGAQLGQTYTYDMALTILFLMGAKKSFTVSQTLIDDLANTLKMVIDQGNVPFSYIWHPDNVVEKGGNFTGASAWVGLALAKYGKEFGDNTFTQSGVDVLNFLLNNLKTDFGSGLLIKGGVGKNWYSTEHNIDCWHLCNYLYYSTHDNRYKILRDKIKLSLLTYMWNDTKGTFQRGKDDTVDALDCSSWGSAFLYLIGETEKAGRALTYCSNNITTSTTYTYINGYNRGEESYNGNHVWIEGTIGVMYANIINGLSNLNDSYYLTLDMSNRDTGGYLYCTDTYEILDDSMLRAPAISSTSWAGLLYLAYSYGTTDDLWISEYTIPVPTPINYIVEPDIYNFKNQYDKRVFLNFPIEKIYYNFSHEISNTDIFHPDAAAFGGLSFNNTIPLFKLSDFKDYVVFDNTQLYITHKTNNTYIKWSESLKIIPKVVDLGSGGIIQYKTIQMINKKATAADTYDNIMNYFVDGYNTYGLFINGVHGSTINIGDNLTIIRMFTPTNDGNNYQIVGNAIYLEYPIEINSSPNTIISNCIEIEDFNDFTYTQSVEQYQNTNDTTSTTPYIINKKNGSINIQMYENDNDPLKDKKNTPFRIFYLSEEG